MDAIPNYQLRIKSPQLCDASVTQYSGYLDTAEDKHFFFWFFEARNVSREDAPLVFWLNGGPGCSSFTGLLMELGPCRVSKGGNGTDYNPFGWNDRAHVIFLDQPTNVGFSHGRDVFNSIAAGKDVDALLQLFYKSFPEYAGSELHVFGESYGGHYVPAVAKAIHESNQELQQRRSVGLLSAAELEKRILPLTSIGIGNGMVDPLTQYKYYSQMACNSTYPPVLSQEACRSMDAAYPTCARLAKACYSQQSSLTCVAAQMYCEDKIVIEYFNSGRNPYDVRLECEGDNLCYPIMTDIDTYLNNPAIQKELGAEVSKFESCSEKVGDGFSLNGDMMKPFHQEIPPLLADNIRVLIYVGDADFGCNWYGNKAWSLAMEWQGKDAFNQAKDEEWNVGREQAGEVRTFENFTFLRVFRAGHMVPYDQPANSLDMINRWLENKPFA
ncbi:peptidase S10, serine carboxypeptidase [Martensiomyces pterosporus]|nr:peptidase S10, serine carboxypeptidase [Martensiomyces pterosporus]